MSISMIFVKVQNLVKATFFQVELLFTHNSYHFADYKLKPDKRNSNTLERKKFCFAPNPNSVSDTETDVFSEHQSAQDQYFALIYYRPQHSCGNVMILHLSIILSTGGRGLGVEGVYPSMHWGRHPPSPADGYCSGRYASYWNAFLLLVWFINKYIYFM